MKLHVENYTAIFVYFVVLKQEVADTSLSYTVTDLVPVWRLSWVLYNYVQTLPSSLLVCGLEEVSDPYYRT
jgi:hypothetical protein